MASKSDRLKRDSEPKQELILQAEKGSKFVNRFEESGELDLLVSKPKSSQDKEHFDEYVHMFKSLKKSIRVFEKELSYSRSTKNVYALIAMYSSQREVIADIRALSDYTENINRIMNKIIRPLFSDITQSNMDVYYHLRKIIIESGKEETVQASLKLLEVLMREQGKMLQKKYEEVQDKLISIVSEG